MAVGNSNPPNLGYSGSFWVPAGRTQYGGGRRLSRNGPHPLSSQPAACCQPRMPSAPSMSLISFLCKDGQKWIKWVEVGLAWKFWSKMNLFFYITRRFFLNTLVPVLSFSPGHPIGGGAWESFSTQIFQPLGRRPAGETHQGLKDIPCMLVVNIVNVINNINVN